MKTRSYAVYVVLIFIVSLSIISCNKEKEVKTSETPKSEEKTKTLPKVFSDGDNAKSERVDSLNMVRYLEIYLADPDPKTGKIVAACYNTSVLRSEVPADKNTAPQNLVEGLDFEKMKKEYDVAAASLNGPKLWMLDWIETEVGVTREFNGIRGTWCAQLNMDKSADVNKMPAYKPTTIERKSSVGWNKGTTVLLLDDDEGNTWMMKGFQEGLKPEHTYEQFIAAGASSFKKLPPGWKFRIKKLDKDYIETPENGVATVMPDEFFNIYDKTGPGMGNYKP